MSMLDNSTASSAAASEPPPPPLDGIELQPEGAAEHLADASAEAALPNASAEAAPSHLPNASPEAAPEHLPNAPAEDSPSAAAPNSASSAPAAGEEAPAAAPVLETSAKQSAQKHRGRPFEPGQSGNPNGRPKGARNRVTRAVEALIDGQGEALGAKAVEKALQGDSPMLRALLGTLVPPRRERTVEFDLPKIESAADALKASSAVIAACAAGELSPREARQIMELISTHVRASEVAERAGQAAALEEKQSSSEERKFDESHPLYESVLAWEEAEKKAREAPRTPR